MKNIDIENLKAKVSELIIIRASGHVSDDLREYPEWELNNFKLRKLIKGGIGGGILLGGTIQELQIRINNLKSWTNKELLICADLEEGVGQRFQGGTHLAPPAAIAKIYDEDPLKAIKYAKEYGSVIGIQAKKIGINWVLAPICDINNNPLNPVINVRSWGDNANKVSLLAASFYEGLSEQGVLACAKHFPGHGDTYQDSHIELPNLNLTKDRLNSLELKPFKKLIELGVESIMTAHLMLPNLDSENPTTFSKEILTNILRNTLGFDGVLVTDALVMKAITNNYSVKEAVLSSFIAGADLILMPANAEIAIDSICEAILHGEIPQERLYESLERRKRFLEKINYVSKNDKIIGTIEEDEHIEFSKKIIFESMEIDIPLNYIFKGQMINLIKTDYILNNKLIDKQSSSVIIPNFFCYKTLILSEEVISPWSNDELNPFNTRLFDAEKYFLQLFIRGNPFRGNSQDDDLWLQTIKQLLRMNKLAGVVIYGSQYFWGKVKTIVGKQVPIAYSPSQEKNAQEIILNQFLSLCSDNSKEIINHKSINFTE